MSRFLHFGLLGLAALASPRLPAAGPSDAELYAADHLAANAFKATQPAEVPNKLMQKLRLSGLSSAGVRLYVEGGVSVRWTPFRSYLPCPPKDYDSEVTLFGRTYSHPAVYYFPHVVRIANQPRWLLYLDLHKDVRGSLVIADPVEGIIGSLSVPLDDAHCIDDVSRARRAAFNRLCQYLEFSKNPAITIEEQGNFEHKRPRSLLLLCYLRSEVGSQIFHERAAIDVDFDRESLNFIRFKNVVEAEGQPPLLRLPQPEVLTSDR